MIKNFKILIFGLKFSQEIEKTKKTELNEIFNSFFSISGKFQNKDNDIFHDFYVTEKNAENGNFSVMFDYFQKVTCYFCKGERKISTLQNCFECEGDGFNEISYKNLKINIKCNHCKGQKEIYNTCKNCKGGGFEEVINNTRVNIKKPIFQNQNIILPNKVNKEKK